MKWSCLLSWACPSPVSSRGSWASHVAGVLFPQAPAQPLDSSSIQLLAQLYYVQSWGGVGRKEPLCLADPPPPATPARALQGTRPGPQGEGGSVPLASQLWQQQSQVSSCMLPVSRVSLATWAQPRSPLIPLGGGLPPPHSCTGRKQSFFLSLLYDSPRAGLGQCFPMSTSLAQPSSALQRL